MKIFHDILLPQIGEILAEQGLDNLPWERMLGNAREASQGDLALPCFPFAKMAKKAPDAIATILAAAIDERANSAAANNTLFAEALGEVSAVGGYLNFKADPTWLAKMVLSANSNPETAGTLPTTGEKVLIEHTSANPNGPFHVGRARNAILGDTIVRLNRLAGHEVRAEYYVDDMGKQVAILAWAMENLSKDKVNAILEGAGRQSLDGGSNNWDGKADHERVSWYQAANVLKEQDSSIDQEVGEMVRLSEEGEQSVLDAFDAAFQPVLDGMLETLGRLGIDYDAFTKESKFVIDGSVAEVMDRLQASPLRGVAENGAQYLELESKGISGKSTKFFFQRGDGSSLYATRDISYHEWKWTQCDSLVNILGEDHKLQSKQVAIALEEIGSKAPLVVFYSFIKLPDGKMSTRRGNVVYMDDLLEEAKAQAFAVVSEIRGNELDNETMQSIAEAVGCSAVRFNIIKVAPDKGFTFRWEEALSFEGGSAPFIMYSHTRACSILRKLESLGIDAANLLSTFDLASFDLSASPQSMVDLLRRLALHPDALADSVENNRPHQFANHLLNLAINYNTFYRDCHIVQDGAVNVLYLAISEAARHCIRRGCEGLGIIPITQM
jgi:arginyl-tRNA synthetase